VAGPFLGIDVGSTTVKLVAIDPQGQRLFEHYVRGCGRPREALLGTFAELEARLGAVEPAGVGLTGSGGAAIAALIGGRHVNELIAQVRAVGVGHPDTRTIIEIGGQDSKLMSVAWDPGTGALALADFAMNALCAAGTGAFLDQQADRLGIAIDGEFERIALGSRSPARIAGRCTVFAKSDMVHLQQRGAPLADILAGLCLALARNFRSVIGKGLAFEPPVLFQGGVASNRAVVRAFEEVLGLPEGGIRVPEHHRTMAAYGAALVAKDEHAAGRRWAFHSVAPLRVSLSNGSRDSRGLPPLQPASGRPLAPPTAPKPAFGRPLPVFLGVDVGSVSTNVVLVDAGGVVVARSYLPTAGRPLEAVQKGLLAVGCQVDRRVAVVGAATTGSGRHLVASLVGADVVRNEITAQARGALQCDPEVDTVFEIGGQDSKYIRMDRGVVVDFRMNNACAAGTGSFLEEQAEKLGLDVTRDFSPMALAASEPVCLGERCTVFMESDLVHHQQNGANLGDLVGGLAYSVAENYLNRVVGTRPVGRRVLFQGGVAGNASVVSALERLTQRPIGVPPHHDVTGAIGAALLAAEERARKPGEPTRFRGFEAAERRCSSQVFECRACANRCEVSRVVIEGAETAFYGARCDIFDTRAARAARSGAVLPDLFAERETLLMGDWRAPGAGNGRQRVGMPRALTFHDLFPFWRAFFAALEIDIVLSPPTSPSVVRETQERAVTEACFPAKLVWGHVSRLLAERVDAVFLPAIVDRENPQRGQVRNQSCPFVPAVSHLVKAALDSGDGPAWLTPALHFASVPDLRRELRSLARALGVDPLATDAALAAGLASQNAFYGALLARGRAVLDGLEPGQPAAVLVGRPYNTCDLGACQDVPRTLRKIGILPIPIDLLPVRAADVSERYTDLYWRCGQDILGAAAIVAADPRLQAIYMTNFNCGPDSFLLSFFRRSMRGKPYLDLEIDDHTADAGIVTRCEAFFDSVAPR